MTGISPNLNLAAANGTSLTWFTVPFLTHATGLKGSDAAIFISNPHSTLHAFAVIMIGWLSGSHTWTGNFPLLAMRRRSVESWIMRVDGLITSCQVLVGRRVLSWVWLSVYKIYKRKEKPKVSVCIQWSGTVQGHQEKVTLHLHLQGPVHSLKLLSFILCT